MEPAPQYMTPELHYRKIETYCRLDAQTAKLAYLARDEIARRADSVKAHIDSMVALALWLNNPFR